MRKEARKGAGNANVLPKILVKFSHGGIYLQWVRCGKKNCRCATGVKHKAYYYFERYDGKTKKTYIRKADLPAVRERVEEVTYWRNRIRLGKKHTKESIKVRRSEKRDLRKAGIKEEPINWEYMKFMTDQILKHYNLEDVKDNEK